MGRGFVVVEGELAVGGGGEGVAKLADVGGEELHVDDVVVDEEEVGAGGVLGGCFGEGDGGE